MLCTSIQVPPFVANMLIVAVVFLGYLLHVFRHLTMVFQRLWAALRCVKDYMHDLLRVCRGYEPCLHDDCEHFVHVDDPTFPECWHCYREHRVQDLTNYVMEQFMLNNGGQYDVEPSIPDRAHELRRR